MDFGFLPPEINSARMYAGAGSGPMLAAAAAWDGLAAQLRSTAASYSSVISGLTAGWQGPSAASMAAAAAPYAAWTSATAVQAEQAATQARAAVGAYETAFAATVPPPVIAANRSLLASQLATNVFGQNTAAIAATEAEYGDMWAQDAAAMYGYAGSSAAATTLTAFSPPPQTTNPTATAGQAAAVAQATGASAGNAQSTLSQAMSAVPQALQSAAAPTTPSLSDLISDFIAFITGSTDPTTQFSTLSAYAEVVPKLILPANDVMITAILGFVASAAGLKALPAAGAAAGSALAAGLSTSTHVLGSAGLGMAAPAVSAGVGGAGMVGALSVPPSWAAATPTIRLAAAALQDTSLAAAPTATAGSTGSLLSQMALASMAGSALGGTAPRAIGGAAARGARLTSGKDKDSHTPEQLKRALAQVAQKPESVQHWHTDQAHLQSLLDQLSKKPGIHAVHVSDGNKKKTTSITSQAN